MNIREGYKEIIKGFFVTRNLIFCSILGFIGGAAIILALIEVVSRILKGGIL